MSPVWTRLLIWHLAVLAGGGVLGALYGNFVIGLLISALAILVWHLWNLSRLEAWLFSDDPVPLPDGNGVWPRVFARIDHVHRRSALHRKNWRRLVKELRASAKAFPDGGVVLSTHFEIVNYNKAARQLLGLRRKRDRGQRIDHLIRHPDFVSYLESGAPKQGVVIPSPTVRDTWLSCRVIPYGPEQKLLLVRDITQTVKMEQMRRDFVANASHELRSPLTVIAGYLDSLSEDENLSAAWRAPVSDMQAQAERMSVLVRDLLQLSRLESSESSPKDKRIDLAALLLAARKDVQTRRDQDTPDIDVQLESQAGLLGEETEIQSIVINLVDNAVRYTPGDGTITVRWTVDKKGGHLSVRDNGIGIAAEDIPRITERFYRADAGRSAGAGGTGLGLAIVKHALKRHDGRLDIASKPGEGSTFVCHFPADRVAMT